MTTIYCEALPVAHLTFDSEWRLDYDPTWMARRSAFPVSLTMQLRSGPVGAERLLPTGHFPSQKYERSSTGRGVALKMMFDVISNLVSPAERLKLLDAVIFNVLVCNSDSHAKNNSVLMGAGGSAKMAPIYDLVCAAVYRQVDQSLPQGIAGRFNASDLQRPDWLALANDIGLSGTSTARRLDELCERVSAACGDVAPQIAGMTGDPARVLERITHSIQTRCRRIQAQCLA
jgi:serine/threonine-protein kinase HipA